ncbi:MAG TPA: hypothetical protein VIR58_16900 [Acidimicrobiales bacterium]
MPSSKRRRQQSNKHGPTPRRARSASTISDDAQGVEQHPSTVGRRLKRSGPQTGPQASARYTPKFKARGPFRPTWHKVVGALLVVLGLSIFVINDLAWFDINIIPGGHNELWALLAFAVAGTSTWWFGWFDRPPGQPGR